MCHCQLERRILFESMHHQITKDTVAGGDWNGVSDVTLDVQKRDPLSYDNMHGRTLNRVIAQIGLLYVHRQQLGQSGRRSRVFGVRLTARAPRMVRVSLTPQPARAHLQSEVAVGVATQY